jgi:glycerophosphoryl diester phosphodiesterase
MNMNVRNALAEARRQRGVLVVAHRGVAGGNIPCNSLPAFEAALRQGADILETDLALSGDGQLLIFHPKKEKAHLNKDIHLNEMTMEQIRELRYVNIDNDPTPYGILTLDEFLECKIYRNFTPVWLGDIVDFLRENEGTYIVTDIKDDNLAGAAAIAEFAPDLKNRFIVQIYDESEYDAIRALGFEYIVYTLYRLDWGPKVDWKALGEFSKTHPLIGFTFSYELCSVNGYVEGMQKSGTPLYIHTVNGEEEQQPYFAMGITGIYTDDVK